MRSLSTPSPSAAADDRQGNVTSTPRCEDNMTVVGMQQVYDHIRHSALYIFWAMIYLYLIFVQQPLTYCFVNAADWIWDRFPLRTLRDFSLSVFKAALCRFCPTLAERFLSTTPYGAYLGADKNLKEGEQKQIPLHSVSLQGCAWMLPYHIGVCEVLKRERVVDDRTIWLGSSGGALIAAAAAMDLDLEYQLKFCISMGVECNDRHALGPAGRMSQYIGPHVMRSLPKEAHIEASGRLMISVTQTPYHGKFCGNVLVGNFKSRNHLHHILMSSTYIPAYYEMPVRPGRAVFFWDGGFSNNQPVLRDPHTKQCLTTTVSPTANKADISPATQTICNIEHLFPRDYESAMGVYEQGKKDAKRYVASLRSKYDIPKPLPRKHLEQNKII